MNSILLLAALAADPATSAPPETVYVERTINPQAAPAPTRPRGPAWVKDALAVGVMAGGTYLFFDAVNNREFEIVVENGGQVDLRRKSWTGKMTIGAGIFVVGALLAAVR